MHYQTIVLELLQQHPALHDQLRASRTLLPTLQRLAGGLKSRHEEWMATLSQSRPTSSREQLASEALELALQELQEALPNASPPDGDDWSLDAAMAFLTRPTPPA